MAASKKAGKPEARGRGALHMVATPIGNLGDVSERMRKVLAGCDAVAAEDTRVARRLLSACGIAGKRVVSVREHNERKAAAGLARTLAGKSVAYVSDAGTPSVSDPGAVLCRTLAEAGFEVLPVPGPSAVTAALSVSPFPAEGHVFAGFLPRRKGEFTERLRACRAPGLPVVVFESPRRVRTALSWIEEALGEEVGVCMCRELTKVHERVLRGTPAELAEALGECTPKGEFTLVIEAGKAGGGASREADALALLRELSRVMPPAKAARVAARVAGADARELYRKAAGTKAGDG